jgi:hypothetical protein
MNTSIVPFSIHFGALPPKLSQQLREQGFRIDRITLGHLQKDADAITRLKIRGFLSDREAKAKRLHLLGMIECAMTRRAKP